MKIRNQIEYCVWGNYALFSDPIARMGRKVQLYASNLSGAERNHGEHLLEAINYMDGG